jgi:hypothetical protein
LDADKPIFVLSMAKFVLYENKVWRVVREEHYNDHSLVLATETDEHKRTYWIPRVKCDFLDPALTILFEGKQHE